MAEIVFTFVVAFDDGSAHRLEYRCEEPDWAEISAGSMAEIAATGIEAARVEFERRDHNAAAYVAPLENQFKAWLRRLSRDLRTASTPRSMQ